MEEIVLSVSELSLYYALYETYFPIIERVSFSIQKAETLVLLGESGSGKTQTALSLIQLLPITAKFSVQTKIFLFDTDVSCLPNGLMEKLRGKQISIIFQEAMSALNPVLTVYRQLYDCFSLNKQLSQSDIRKKYSVSMSRS
jgi:ABC-type microcin C transport system duplicated ATPase subunit YejF